MNDDLEQRLTALGQMPVPPLGRDRVHAIEDGLLASTARPEPRRAVWLVAAAAAAVLLASVAFAAKQSTDRSLEPATPPSTRPDLVATSVPPSTTTVTTAASTSLPATSTTTDDTVVSDTSPSTEAAPPGVTQPPPTTTLSSTEPTTTPPPTTAAPTTTQPAAQAVPAASFALSVERIGTRLVFTWPAQAATGGVRYALVRVTTAGLLHWPVAEARIARLVPDIGATRTVIEKPDSSPASWVLVVLGADRRLLAVSTIATSA